MEHKTSYTQDLINNIIWALILNISSILIGKPMYLGKNVSLLRTLLYFIVGFLWLGSWIVIVKLLSKKTKTILALIITIPSALLVNFILLKLFGL